MKLERNFKIKLFADGADKAGMIEMYKQPWVSGFTTNPTLCRKAGVTDFEAFAKDVLATIHDRPISFEVFSDELDQMLRQGRKIATWGPNVYVKIPITNTKRQPTTALIRELSHSGVKLNVTAVFTLDQVKSTVEALRGGAPAVVSIFAGRIADAGVDPVPHMREALKVVRTVPGVELLWASPRETLNVIQAEEVGCDIITMTSDLLKKLPLIGKDLDEYSLETVKMFYTDATAAGFSL
jgi:transaldolase